MIPQMHRTIVVGSPNPSGRSAMLADAIFEACIEDCPDDGVSVVSVASTNVGPCKGCDACRNALDKDDPRFPKIPEWGDPLMQCRVVFKSDASSHQCVIDDDISEVRKHIDAADELIVVSPVYFSGTPAQLKALLDRMQPYFFSDIRSYTKHRRPMTLHVVREGGNPYGFKALESTVRSAFGAAGFRLERLLDWKGCFDAEGDITAEPREILVIPATAFE